MELSESQLTEINQLITQYWYGTREIDRFTITDDVVLTIDHTETDEVRFTVSFSDITQFETPPPNQLSQLTDSNTIVQQITQIIRQNFGENATPVSLYKDPTVRLPMAQYTALFDLKNKSQELV